jgi:hypothetical protein
MRRHPEGAEDFTFICKSRKRVNPPADQLLAAYADRYFRESTIRIEINRSEISIHLALARSAGPGCPGSVEARTSAVRWW